MVSDASPERQVTETINVIITATILRTAIRAKLRRGAQPQIVSALIKAYAAEEAQTARRDGIVHRLPVEVIPYERRIAFLEALNQLSEQRAQGKAWIAELVPPISGRILFCGPRNLATLSLRSSSSLSNEDARPTGRAVVRSHRGSVSRPKHFP